MLPTLEQTSVAASPSTNLLNFFVQAGQIFKSKLTNKKYNTSAGGKDKRATYRQSADGKATRDKYGQSAAGKATRAAYEHSAAGKASKKRCNKRYKRSAKGKATRKRWHTKKFEAER